METDSTRMTNQRLKIITYLQNVKTHPTAEMVYESVKKDLPAISLATVYRNLNLLAGQGKILKLEINNEFRFDGDVSGHLHCVCDSCGKIIDVFQKEIPANVMKSFSSELFTPEKITVILNGKCNKCK